MIKCPRCNGAAVQYSKPHCESHTCNWFVCQHCKTTYDKTTLTGFRFEGKATWHTSQRPVV